MANENSSRGGEVLTAEQKRQQARLWVETSRLADEARDAILGILRVAPVHTACLGEFGKEFAIPSPVSAVIRELCGDKVAFYTARESPVGCPALAYAECARDNCYWGRFRKKGLREEAGDNSEASPWALLGIPSAANGVRISPSDVSPVRAKIFAAFMEDEFGGSVIKEMSAVCLEFKKVSGVNFSQFFDGLRPVEFMETLPGREMFNWSWTTRNPPCLNCALKRDMAASSRLMPRPDVVNRLVDQAMHQLPEQIDFDDLAARFDVPDRVVMICYLRALRKAIQIKSLGLNASPKGRADASEAVRQLLDISRELASVANRIAAIAERLVEDGV